MRTVSPAREDVLARLQTSPGLIDLDTVRSLRGEIAAASRGESFLLQAGPCLETFDDSAVERAETIELVLDMAGLIGSGELPVVCLGRMAGQYWKNRRRPTETRGDVTLPAYRGDGTNGVSFDRLSREPDITRLLTAYEHSRTTAAAMESAWRKRMNVYGRSARGAEEASRAGKVAQALASERLPQHAGQTTTSHVRMLGGTTLYLSHEAISLDYEAGLTRRDPATDLLVATSAAMLWLGTRSLRDRDELFDFAGTVENPIGLKVGPDPDAESLLRAIDVLNPQNLPGKVVLITRMGAANVGSDLPQLIERIHAAGAEVAWMCDPMHGNTISGAEAPGRRLYPSIVAEVRRTFAVHHAARSRLAGLHLELTSAPVLEVLGGLDLEHLANPKFDSAFDPRLNLSQSIELAAETASILLALGGTTS